MPGAYYNEFDPFAAAWLRELIKNDLIMDGDVDERPIQDVRVDDLNLLRNSVCLRRRQLTHLFKW